LRRLAEPHPDLQATLNVPAEVTGIVIAPRRGEDPADALRRFEQHGTAPPEVDPLRAMVTESASLAAYHVDGGAPAASRP
jgi:hypothetical protein